MALDRVREVFAARPGYLSGWIGRSLDEPTLLVLITEWADVGSYRRALSSYDGKLVAAPVLGHALDEPSAFEDAAPGTEVNIASTRSIN